MSQPSDFSPATEDISPVLRASEPPSLDHLVRLEEMFTLIDGILPFEACLYYQVLPLSINGSRLNLGMVNPKDDAATDYVRRQVSYVHYSIIPWQIASDWHRDALSRYLSYAAKLKQLRQRNMDHVEQPDELSSSAVAKPFRNLNNQATLVVDTPEELEDEATPFSSSSVSSTVPAKPQPAASRKPELKFREPVSLGETLGKTLATSPLHLDIHPKYRNIPLKNLVQLAPNHLMEALLACVLESGIGRLYFERHADYGRVLWSKDGVVQSVIDPIDLERFQAVINEFKRLTHLPLIRMDKARQVEIERLYQNERVLLRLRVMPTAQGDEATLQVLRGMALRFYQQQQIEHLGRDALGVAQTLQQRLNEIRERARQSFDLTGNQVALPNLAQMLREMEGQIQEMLRNLPEQNALPQRMPPNDMPPENSA